MKILDTVIEPGSSHILNFNKAKLYTATSVDVPVIVHRAEQEGPTVLLTGGVHGDEINGVEVVRQIISKKLNKPSRGTILCMPVVNVFGFLNGSRDFPDGRDLNRSFSGSASGPLANRFAHGLVTDILPQVDYVMDFHTGGGKRFNAPHIRIDMDDEASMELAEIFGATFIVDANTSSGTFRRTLAERKIPNLLFEGGRTGLSDKHVVLEAVDGVKRVLTQLQMLTPEVTSDPPEKTSIIVTSSRWMRADVSGLLHPRVKISQHVQKGEMLATITDPYGSFREQVVAPHEGHIITLNESPLVYQGDAIFRISKLND